MWPTVALWALSFVLAWVENVIVTRGAKADRSSQRCTTNRRSIHAANWDVAFCIIIIVDSLLVFSQGLDLLIPIAAGSWLGTYTELERRRKKWREKQFSSTNQPKRIKRRKPSLPGSTPQDANDVQVVD